MPAAVAGKQQVAQGLNMHQQARHPQVTCMVNLQQSWFLTAYWRQVVCVMNLLLQIFRLVFNTRFLWVINTKLW